MPSKGLYYWLIGIHISVFIVILILPLNYLFKLLFLALVVLLYLYSRYKQKQKLLILSLVYDKNDQWKLCRQNETLAAELLKQNFISDFLLVLYFKCEGARLNTTLFRHQLTAQDWRCLQMIVRN